MFFFLVIGALLGTQDGRDVEIFNSFELQFDVFDDGHIIINMEYYRTKEEQCMLSNVDILTGRQINKQTDRQTEYITCL